MLFFFNDTATTEIYTLSLHDGSSDLIEVDANYKYDRLWVYDLAAQQARLVTKENMNIDDFFCDQTRSEEHTSELQSLTNLVCRLLLEKKKKKEQNTTINT